VKVYISIDNSIPINFRFIEHTYGILNLSWKIIVVLDSCWTDLSAYLSIFYPDISRGRDEVTIITSGLYTCNYQSYQIEIPGF